jgi:hypothetical protein
LVHWPDRAIDGALFHGEGNMKRGGIALGGTALCIAVAALLAGPVRAGEMKFEHVMNIGQQGTGEGQFKYVEDFAFTKDGKLLATDAAHAWVQVFDKTTGKYLGRFGGRGEDEGSLVKPEGIAVDPEGNIFVADYNTGFIKKYDASTSGS